MLRSKTLRILRRAALLTIGLVALAACQPQDAPAKAIERYLQAVVDKDADRAITSSCAAWEEDASKEIDSFKAVGVELKDLACQTSGDDGDAKLVTCSGTIAVTYNNENREVSLSGKTYVVTQEGGDWRMCGYR